MRPSHRIEITNDGSPTVVSGIYQTEYHSKHGAVTESLHVFLQEGFYFYLDQYKPEKINLLEYGFGTGLNAYLTALACEEGPCVMYDSLELHPLDKPLISTFYQKLFTGDSEKNSSYFLDVHDSKWNETVEIHPHFSLKKIRADFRNFSPSKIYDLVFFDAFGPGTQADLWTEDIFKPLWKNMSERGILVTYCVQGDFRRMLQRVGFDCQKLPGPPGKREMLRAVKISS